MSLLILSDNSVLIGRSVSGGNTVSGSNCIQRFDQNGKPSPFAADTKVKFTYADDLVGPEGITTLAQQSDGKVIVAGTFTSVDGISSPGLGRFENAGAKDESFSPEILSPPLTQIRALCIQQDGKIVLGGAFRLPNKSGDFHLLRLNSSGELDRSFTPVAVSQTTLSRSRPAVWQLALQNDGKFLARGPFTKVQGENHVAIVRLNNDGSIDPTFNSLRYNFDSQISSMLLDEPRGLFVAGSFNSVDLASRTNIVRLFVSSRPNSARLPQVIQFGSIPDQVFGVLPIPLIASASSGLPVTFRVLSGNVTLFNSNLVFTGAGPVSIVATQAGNDNYDSAREVTQSFNVAKASQTIRFDPVTGLKYLDPELSLVAVASSGLPVTFEIVSGPVGLKFGNSNLLLTRGSGTATLRAIQIGDSNFEPISTEQTFTIAKATQAITFSLPAEMRLEWQRLQLDRYTTARYPITYEVVSGPAHLDGPILLLDAQGSVSLRATQPGDENVEPALPAEWTIKIYSGPSLTLDTSTHPFALTWPTIYDDFVLEESSSLDGPWIPSQLTPLIAGVLKVKFEPDQPSRFFHLRSSPLTP